MAALAALISDAHPVSALWLRWQARSDDREMLVLPSGTGAGCHHGPVASGWVYPRTVVRCPSTRLLARRPRRKLLGQDNADELFCGADDWGGGCGGTVLVSGSASRVAGPA